ncbi:hypothetical protein [Stenotrophomonas phage BUCT555]|nr:hypothetical protein [Stenotrophomonas phage BUCT555]
MASNVRMPNGVDTDSVWPGRLTSAISAVNVRASNAQDFSSRYEKANGAGASISANIRAPDGVDLSLKFTTVAANPVNWSGVRAEAYGSPTEGSALATVNFTSNGGIGAAPTGGNWLSPNAPLGSLYQIYHNVVSSSGTGTNFITPGVWLDLDSGRLLQISKGNVGIFQVNGTSQIRRKSDGAVVCGGDWVLYAQYFGS